MTFLLWSACEFSERSRRVLAISRLDIRFRNRFKYLISLSWGLCFRRLFACDHQENRYIPGSDPADPALSTRLGNSKKPAFLAIFPGVYLREINTREKSCWYWPELCNSMQSVLWTAKFFIHHPRYMRSGEYHFFKICTFQESYQASCLLLKVVVYGAYLRDDKRMVYQRSGILIYMNSNPWARQLFGTKNFNHVFSKELFFILIHTKNQPTVT